MMEIINIKGNGKTKKEIREELINQIDEKLNKAFEDFEDDEVINEKPKKKKKDEEEHPPMHIKIIATEDDNREGFGVSTSIEGEYSELMTMLTMSVVSALEAINEGEFSDSQLFTFITALIHEYNDRSKKED